MKNNYSEAEIALQEKLKQAEKENKSLMQKLETANSKKAKLQTELKKRRTENRTEQRTTTITLEPITGHRYSELAVRLSSLLYTRGGCGLRSVITILEVINETFEGILGEIPCYNTIGNWIRKYGLYEYNSSGESLVDEHYAEVVDESMMIGSEKLLVTLAVPAAHQGRPLSHSDVSVLDISVSTSWTAAGVKTQLEKSAEKVGHAPDYVISDNASIMNKGIRLCGIDHHRDINHSLGMYLERTYKESIDFKAFLREMSDVKFKHNMQQIAYLLPPTQRTIARFINLSGWVKCSCQMLEVYHMLSSEEQSVFSFIQANGSFINELSDVVDCVEGIESICKRQGFWRESVIECQLQIRKSLMTGNRRMIQLGCDILNFLKIEATLLKSDDDVHNNSSDIMESVFGTFKARKSPNKLHGFTSFILFIPAHTQLLNSKKDAELYRFKERLERVRLKDIDDWAAENLSSNRVVKRMKTVKKAG